MKVQLVTNIIAPYRVPIFNALAAQREFEFRVLFCARTEQRRQWKIPENVAFNFDVAEGARIQRQNGVIYVSPRILSYLWQFKPDVVLTGGFSVPTWYAWLYSKLVRKRVSVILFGEGTQFTERCISKVGSLSRRFLVSNSAACVGASSDASDYFISLGAPSERVYTSLLTTDVDAFRRLYDGDRDSIDLVKRRLGLPAKVILYCGNLTHAKGVHFLLEAFRLVAEKRYDVGLMLLGGGDQEKDLREQCLESSLTSVTFAGFKQQHELPLWYKLADLFVFPTLCDRFGVVVVEAVTSGLPIICSKFAGAARDLVSHGKNGYIVDPRNTARLAGYLAEILDDDQLRAKMGQESINMREKCDVGRAVDGFVQAILTSTGAVIGSV